MADANMTRREILTKAAYVTPAIVTLPVLLSFASAGSGHPGDDEAHGPHQGGNRGKHYGWERGKHYGWERGKHYGWEKPHGP